MPSLDTLVMNLRLAVDGDRRLDSEILAAVLGPPGCVIDPVQGLDGWDIQFAPDDDGEAACWRDAADVPPVTTYLDAASELVMEAHPGQAAAILARAMRRTALPCRSMSGEAMVGRMARSVIAELLQFVMAEHCAVYQAA